MHARARRRAHCDRASRSDPFTDSSRTRRWPRGGDDGLPGPSCRVFRQRLLTAPDVTHLMPVTEQDRPGLRSTSGGDVRRGNRAQSLQREPDLSADGWPQDGWEHFLQIECQWRDLIFPSPSPGKGLGQRLAFGCSWNDSILALIFGPPPTVWTISPLHGASPLSSEKRSRDASRQMIVISHVAFTIGTLQRAVQIVSTSVCRWPL